MRTRTRVLLGLGIPVLVVVLLLAAWALDASSTRGKVPRNVTLANRDISKLPEDELAATVGDVAAEYARMVVQLRTDNGPTLQIPAGKLGLKLDRQATADGALDLDKKLSTPGRPLTWAGSFLHDRTASLHFTIDETTLEAGLASLAGNAAPTEPSIVRTSAGYGILSGSPGKKIDIDDVRTGLLRRANSGETPLVVDARLVSRPPLVTDQAAQAAAEKLSVSTAKGLAVNAGTAQTSISTETLRTWVGATVKGDKVLTTLDAAKALADLTTALPPPTTASDASITLVNNAPQITPSVDGSKCCAIDTPDRLTAAVDGGSGAAVISLEVTKPGFTTEGATALGIVAPVGTTTVWKNLPQVNSFTTYYDPGAPRVINIHRIADIVRGTIVRPGQTFSINTIVGQRTVDKGFVIAGAIANGEHDNEVGGGVSQFATTMFNAAFFDGLPFKEYQAHSEYFDRYPFGREATMGFEHPDLQWVNNTPYGIMVWTSYTDTSITITLYSTQFAYGEQTGQTTGRSGKCTTVSTQRTIRYVDGRIGTDTVGARYRDPGATSC
jgi:vancomycin resistance protein YoaR